VDLRNGFSGLKTARFGLKSLLPLVSGSTVRIEDSQWALELNCTINSGAAVEMDVDRDVEN
jgi:hypothetical protein